MLYEVITPLPAPVSSTTRIFSSRATALRHSNSSRIIVSPVSIFYFILAPWPVNLVYLLLIVSLIGALIGGLYGVFSMGSRIYRADASYNFV